MNKTVRFACSSALVVFGLLTAMGCNDLRAVIATSPAAGSVNAELDATISITFDGDIPPGFANQAVLTVVGPGGLITGSTSLVGPSVSFVPAATLTMDSLYTVTLAPINGQQVQPYSWSFRTKGRSWSEPLTIASGPNAGPAVAMAMNSSGEAAILWVANYPNPWYPVTDQLWVTKFSPSAGWSVSVRIDHGIPQHWIASTSVAISTGGDVMAIWTETDSSGSGEVYSALGHDGQPWTSSSVSGPIPGINNAKYTSVSRYSGEGFIACWVRGFWPSAHDEIWVAKSDGTGGSWYGHELVHGGDLLNVPQIAGFNDGSALCTWATHFSGYSSRVFRPQTSWGAVEFLTPVPQGIIGGSVPPLPDRMAADDHGNAILCWSPAEIGQNYVYHWDVRARTFTLDEGWSESVTFEANTYEFTPRAAMDNEGGAWLSYVRTVFNPYLESSTVKTVHFNQSTGWSPIMVVSPPGEIAFFNNVGAGGPNLGIASWVSGFDVARPLSLSFLQANGEWSAPAHPLLTGWPHSTLVGVDQLGRGLVVSNGADGRGVYAIRLE